MYPASGTSPTSSLREKFAMKKSYSIENGYNSRRRSLVEDAKFETTVNKKTKEKLLEEVRQATHDEELSEEELYLSEGLFLEQDGIIDPKNLPAQVRGSIVIGLKDGMAALPRVLKTVENCQGLVLHVETRTSRIIGTQFDVLIKLEIPRESLMVLIKSLRRSNFLTNVSLLSEQKVPMKQCWFPRHVSDLDNCNHLMTKFEPDLDMDHPGFADTAYRARRKEIANVAFDYRYGEVIPRIEYNDQEVTTWGAVFDQLLTLFPTHACKQHRSAFELLRKEGLYTPDKIPQLEEVSRFLQKCTGFTVRPAAGLLTARDFLSSLAFRVFQSTQYVRHSSSPYHSPEPDCIHELLGHIPMLADPEFAQLSQELGLASLGATDEEIEKLSTVYWFTVEFGLCKENGKTLAYGAGLLSSYGELMHALSDKPERRPFNAPKTAVQPYQDQDYQDVYFVAESFEDAKDKLRHWVRQTMVRPFEVRYNPFTKSIELLDSVERLQSVAEQLQVEVTHLNQAVTKLKFQ